MMPERASRTFICSVLFLDIVDYSRKPVAEQILLKDRFNAMITSAIKEIPPADRIILDTGDGVAINFLGDPEDALFVAMSLRDTFAPDRDKPLDVPARIGINLGPVRLVRDLNAQPNIIGDGINVAQRVMGFANAGQILVSRSYYDIVSHISEGYSNLFSYEGSHTDKHVREHEVYSVGYSTSGTSVRSPADRMHHSENRERDPEPSNPATKRLLQQVERWLGNRSLAYGTAAFSAATFLLALLTSFMGQTSQEQPLSHATSVSGKLASAPTDQTGDAARIESPPLAGNLERESQAQQLPPDSATLTVREHPAPTAAAKRPKPRFFGTGPNDDSPQSGAPRQERLRPQSPSGQSESATAARDASGSSNSGAQKQTPAWTADTKPRTGTTERATVSLAITPWGDVYIDGKHIGVSPPVNEVNVHPGRRTIEIRNGNFPPYTQRVELRARQKIKIRYKFN
jgi:PEGA domain-containing protein